MFFLSIRGPVNAKWQQCADAINRFRNETLRVFGVLEIQLSGIYRGGEPREYLVGAGKGKYSIADIKAWSWIKGWKRSGFGGELGRIGLLNYSNIQSLLVAKL